MDTINVTLTDLTFPAKLEDKFCKFRPLPVAATPFFPATLPITLTLIKSAVEQGTNKKISDLQKSVIDKAIGKEDGAARSIFSHSQTLTSEPRQTITLNGGGVQGDYSVTLEIEAT
jgi:hypothetical protein